MVVFPVAGKPEKIINSGFLFILNQLSLYVINKKNYLLKESQEIIVKAMATTRIIASVDVFSGFGLNFLRARLERAFIKIITTSQKKRKRKYSITTKLENALINIADKSSFIFLCN
jgi:acyl-coenzyme A synthetase/AMP-(fatty) acid ligase